MFIDLVKKTRSTRSFNRARTITEDELIKIVEAARYSSSAVNLQPLKYRLVYKEEELARTLAITAWGGALSQLKLPPEGKAPTAYIVICHDTDITPEKPIFLIDVGIAAQSMMLAASDMGLSACMLGSATKKDLQEVLGLSDNPSPQLVLAIGEGVEDIRVIDAEEGKTKYFRDADGVHYVPKRPLSELIIK